jgi:hypothetical protein
LLVAASLVLIACAGAGHAQQLRRGGAQTAPSACVAFAAYNVYCKEGPGDDWALWKTVRGLTRALAEVNYLRGQGHVATARRLVR